MVIYAFARPKICLRAYALWTHYLSSHMFIALLLSAALLAPDPAYPVLEKGYAALAAKDYHAAVSHFKSAAELAPDRPDIHKNLAYTLLKTGDTLAARDSFERAMTLDPKDQTSALEFAFLAHETGQTRQAPSPSTVCGSPATPPHSRLSRTSTGPSRKVSLAGSTFCETNPPTSPLTRNSPGWPNCETQLPLSAEHFLAAWRLRPAERHLLVSLAKVHFLRNEPNLAMPPLLAAARSGNPRAIEQAKGLLPNRYPYVYEFEQALALDPTNVELRRELAYLHLAMNQPAKAQHEFEILLQQVPKDRAAQNQLALLKGQPVSTPDPSAAAAPIIAPKAAPPPPPPPARPQPNQPRPSPPNFAPLPTNPTKRGS